MAKTCFVVCAFGEPGSQERRHSDIVFHYIISPAAKDAGYSASRADHSSYSGQITVDIINSILDADLVVADLSFLNPNVFYEMGLRHSTQRPTIHIASNDTVLPFDNADHRALFYDPGDYHSHLETRARLTQYIRALETSHVTNPVTIAQAHKNDRRLQQVIEGVARFIEQLQVRVERLTDEPEPGHITREKFSEITEQHKSEILLIVSAIRQRIQDRASQFDTTPLPQVSDVLRRLGAIEHVVMNGNAMHMTSGPTTHQ